MMTPTSPDRIRRDTRLVGQTLYKLALGRIVVTALAVAVAVLVWLLVASWLLDFGRGLRFDGLQALGQQSVEFLARINPYVWWGIVAIWSLIVFFLVRGGVRAIIAGGRATAVPAGALSGLATQLSDEARSVLRWVWGDRAEPFTLGDLQRAHAELRHDRIGKIAMVQEQSAILDAPAQEIPAPSPSPAADAESRPARHVEPHIGAAP
ncbi:hypothetical protein [Bordetella sp. 2513F-2]